jgi:hypothetical protein
MTVSPFLTLKSLTKLLANLDTLLCNYYIVIYEL